MIKIGSKWKYSYNSKEYTVILITNIFTEYSGTHPVMIVYIGKSGKIWCKSESDFLEKMKEIKYGNDH